MDEGGAVRGPGGRALPTEAEWEYGCRGADGRMYPWATSRRRRTRLNYYNEYGRTIDVGTIRRRQRAVRHGGQRVAVDGGLVQRDLLRGSAAQESPLRNPAGPAEETGNRTLRGGSWRNDGNLVRCAFRDNDPPGSKYYNVGLRVVAPGF